jgi:hypothetical protein
VKEGGYDPLGGEGVEGFNKGRKVEKLEVCGENGES